MSTTFRITNTPGKRHIINNELVCHPDDFISPHIWIFNTVYKLVSGNVGKGELGVGLWHRAKYNVSFDSEVTVRPIQPISKTLKKLNLTIITVQSNGPCEPIHETIFIDTVKRKFKDWYFSGNQIVALEIGYDIYCLQVGQNEGYLKDSTDITLLSKVQKVNMIKATFLKSDLFQDDFSFESIGVGGLDAQMANIFRRALVTRTLDSTLSKKLGVKHVKGILLYGPPGTGKTLIARNIGSLLSNNPPQIINGPEIMNKYVGQSEENIRKLFQPAIDDYNKNKEDAGLHIIIFDEIDAICKKRAGGEFGRVNDSMVNQLLTMIDGYNEFDNIFLIAMTNRKDLLDEALLRPGRLEVHVKINLPDKRGRLQIFRIHTQTMSDNNFLTSNIDFDKLADLTENFSGAEIEAVVKNARSRAIYEKIRSKKEEDILVTMDHFVGAVSEIIPAFGNHCQQVEKLLPKNYDVNLNSNTYEKIKNIILASGSKSLLLSGASKTGKSTMIYHISNQYRFKLTKIVRAIDFIKMNEYLKSQFLIDLLQDTFLSEESLIVIDDIEILLEYANIYGAVAYSNKMYQTLHTLLKTKPDNSENKLIIICICGETSLSSYLEPSFDHTFLI